MKKTALDEMVINPGNQMMITFEISSEAAFLLLLHDRGIIALDGVVKVTDDVIINWNPNNHRSFRFTATEKFSKDFLAPVVSSISFLIPDTNRPD